MNEPYMKIGEIAAFFSVSVKSIRIYEKKGIIIPAKIDSKTGYRYYSPAQVQTLNTLIELKSLGFSLAEIKNILQGNIDTNELITKLSQKSTAWKEAITVADFKIDSIDKIIERLKIAKDANKITELTDEQRAWLLVKMICVEEVSVRSALSEAIWL